MLTIHLKNFHTIYFHYAYWFNTILLAYKIDSLVRVSRRDEEDYFVYVIDE